MEVRRFTDAGLRTFENFLDSCNTEMTLPYPEAALTSPIESEPVVPAPKVELTAITTRFELAKLMNDQFTEAGFRPQRSDIGLWAWLGCFWFPAICPKSPDGRWICGSIARWIPRSTDFRRYYRHLVAGPYFIYRAHADDPTRAMAALCQRPGRPGDLVEQLASRQQIISSMPIMQVATDLFVDPATNLQNKHGNSKKAGGARRFIDVLGQFDVTWDLSMLSAENLRALLPAEFRRT